MAVSTISAHIFDMVDDAPEEAILLRLTTDDRRRLDALSEQLPLEPMTIARIALRLGLAEMKRAPMALFVKKGAVPPAPPPDSSRDVTTASPREVEVSSADAGASHVRARQTG